MLYCALEEEELSGYKAETNPKQKKTKILNFIAIWENQMYDKSIHNILSQVKCLKLSIIIPVANINHYLNIPKELKVNTKKLTLSCSNTFL